MTDNKDFDIIWKAFNRPYEGVRPEILIDVGSSGKRSELVSDILKSSNPEFKVNLLWGNRGAQKIDCSNFSKVELTKFLDEGHYIVLKDFKGIPHFGMSVWKEGLSLHFKPGKHWSMMVVLKFLNFLKKVLMKYSPVKVVIDEKGKFFTDKEIFQIYASIKGRAK
ncbi:MAG: hypothetical protein HRU09_17295 [Oligoflexales bacterium]|nr:hypothetical protein [Oligoflexales bacterium]